MGGSHMDNLVPQFSCGLSLMGVAKMGLCAVFPGPVKDCHAMGQIHRAMGRILHAVGRLHHAMGQIHHAMGQILHAVGQAHPS